MVSRIDRLFILLDTGANESIRLAAASQLGEVQRVQPNDLNYLLHRIQEYSCKSVWDTRIAAGHATKSVLEHVKPWPPSSADSIRNSELPPDDLEDNKIKCKQDIANKIFDENANNLIDGGEDADDLLEPSAKRNRSSTRKESSSSTRSKKNDKQHIMRQRKLINKELGLSMEFGVKSTDIVSNDDLQPLDYDSSDTRAISASCTTATTSNSSKQNQQQRDTGTIIGIHASNYDKILLRLSEEGCISMPSDHNKQAICKESNKEDCQNSTNSSYEWPIKNIARVYANDLFNSSWETRHGAAICLREIVKSQGKSAGKRSDLSPESNTKLNQLWLIDMSLRALSVLALDKFGDFLFDQVVAPVRENAAQLLGCCVAYMTENNAYSVMKILLKMLENPNWETRHGGILGLKYSLNIVDKLFAKRILQECFEPIYKCLGDSVDDVSAEAAASLVPVKDLMIEVIPEKTPKLIKFLWEHLADLDELTTSTSNIVLLLASLITTNSAHLEPSELTKSIPRLWSLLSHSSTSVRISVLKALSTLMKPQKSTCLSWMPEDLLTTAFRLVFQRAISENMDEVRPYIEEVWMHLIRIDETDVEKSQSERFDLLKSTSQYLNYWLCLILQPTNIPIDRTSPMWLNIKPDGTKSDTCPEGEVFIGSCTFNSETINQQKQQVTKCRLLSTKLVGALYATLTNDFRETPESQHSKDALKYLAEMFAHYIRTKSANQRIVSGWALESWAHHQNELLKGDHEKLKTILPQNLTEQLYTAIQEISLCYDELASTFTRLQHESRDFVSTLRNLDIPIEFLSKAIATDKRAIYNLAQIQQLCEFDIDGQFRKLKSKRVTPTDKDEIQVQQYDITKDSTYVTLCNKRANLTKSYNASSASQKGLSVSVLSSLACAHVSWRIIPKSLDLVINPLMDCIELEEDQTLQTKAINYLVVLLDDLCQKFEQESEESQGSSVSDNQKLIEAILKRLIDTLSCRALGMLFELSDNAVFDIPTSARPAMDSTARGLFKSGTGVSVHDTNKIILLDNLQRKSESIKPNLSRRQSSAINENVGSGISSLKRSHSIATSQELDGNGSMVDVIDANSITLNHSQASSNNNELADFKLRGATVALKELASHFGDKLPTRLPQFWFYIIRDIKEQVNVHVSQPTSFSFDHNTNDMKLIKNLRLLEVVGQSLHDNLKKNLLDLFEDLMTLLKSSNPVIRHHSAQCIGVISKMMLEKTITLISEKIIPMLTSSENIIARCGAIEAIALIIEHLQLKLVPKINMFIVHVLRRMSDQNDQVRLMATHCFGKLLSLMPLNLQKKVDDNEIVVAPSELNIKQQDHEADNKLAQDDLRFIEQLLDPKKLDNFSVPFKIEASLRSYQQDGLNWLAFLNRFNLHGILCDEMGLGKTFMTICMVAADHFNQIEANKIMGNLPRRLRPSLIICPSTLTEHWLYEIQKFLPQEVTEILNPIAYSGLISERMSLRSRIFGNEIGESQQPTKSQNKAPINLVVASYDIVRNDIDFFKEVHWNYCVLDEGHIIKNGKTKLSRAIRLVNAEHRLILSGTPIQNNVTELWSLFDFLMPGFLGSERQFNNKFTKPILQSRELKRSARELGAGALAMESLHRQVLPFILRRLKEEVLDDLPPKIIQDYYCELSPLQHKLYEDFTKSKLCNNVTKKSLNELKTAATGNQEVDEPKRDCKSHVFQALQYLKNVCNHPKLVLTQKHPKFLEFKKSLDSEKSNLDDINHSSKLKALKQLLIDCGIGVGPSNQIDQMDQQQQVAGMATIQSVVNQHRALIFCQVRSMVNIIEQDLFKNYLPGITYLKLDGSVPVCDRQSIVSRFNNDPSIDCLLLTTQIGGLGLNLTGADTVIFVEHDWNPTKDLQAMDRAHRIGQKKVVNVYRLITKGTLEEKIMGLQKFKTTVSNTVINQDNAGLGTMNVDQLFDLFEDQAGGGAATTLGKATGAASAGAKGKSFMDLLPELWDQQQYETEYDLSNFVSSLRN